MIKNFKLIKKEKLTPDVYEMTFEASDKIDVLPGQFVTFLIDKIWWRAYSILKSYPNEKDTSNIVLIIKKREEEDWGRGWSRYICDLEVWDTLKWVWASGSFLLQKNDKNKLFIATGTWIVPLYNQILAETDMNKSWVKLGLVFWVRTVKDLFYLKEIEKIKEVNKNFVFEIYISREETKEYNFWYVTSFLNKTNLDIFEEFYICWAPWVIKSSKEILEDSWKESVYFEEYK